MSERYSRLFALPEDLYSVGSPVVIAAGALLKDNQTGKVIGQLKLRSISPKTIKAVKVKLNLFDTAGNPIGESVAHTYLDLNARRNEEFGQKSPVTVAESQTRSYQASVTEVVFEDQSVWTANEGTWKPLAKPVALSITDPELLKQYQMHYGSGAKYEAKEEKDLWHCTCGALNHEGENCHVCGHSLAELQSVDMVKLTSEKDARLEEAARKAAEEQAAADAQKKKTTKILAIVIPSVCAVVAIVLLVTNVIIPNSKYNDAVALMDTGSYEEAIAAFEAMDGYKDSVQMIENCELAIKYNDAITLMDSGSYEEAIAVFEAMDDYRDSAAKIEACNTAIMDGKYNDAVALIETDVVQAYKALIALDCYKDSLEKANSIYEEYKAKKRNNARIGDYIPFGFYEQDNNTSNGKEEVEWLVLDRRDNKLLVISKYILDVQPYNTDDPYNTWETSTLRKWLNSDFINAAFTAGEKAMIPTVTVEAHKNPDNNNNPGNATQDQVFLLSVTEANKYFSSNSERQCKLTAYAFGDGWTEDNSYFLWVLRSPASYSAGARVSEYGRTDDGGIYYGSYAPVRPAMWIDLNLTTE